MKKNLLLAVISVTVTLLVVEIGLRLYGIIPGIYQYSQWFTPVKNLAIKDGFYADSLGIFKTSPTARKEVRKRVALINAGEDVRNNDSKEVEEIYGVIFETGDNNKGKNESALLAHALHIKQRLAKTDLDSAILDYVFNCPYNTDGFRSISFKKYATNKKKILLIGDSFTWGHSAWPISNCFADELLSRGYVVYNTGVSGADPAQYLAVAKKYIAELKPDYVITNFFMGNDPLHLTINDSVKYYNRTVKPFQPIHYSTNAGNLISAPQGVYFSTADSAYNFVLTYYQVPTNTKFNKAMAATALGTFVWMQLHKTGLVSINVKDYEWYWQESSKNYSGIPYCNEQLRQIDSISKVNNATHFLISIADVASDKFGKPSQFPHMFEGLKYCSSPVNSNGYNLQNFHYNNEGHKQHADYIEQLIKEQ